MNGDGKPELATANAQVNTLSVLGNTTGLCVAPKVIRMTVAAAKRAIARADCRVGTIGRAYSRTVKTGRVISQRPRPGMVLRKGGKVTLIVSRGRKR